jgi:hypothetical protein
LKKWRQEEKADHKAMKIMIDKEWKAYVTPFHAQKKQPLQTKPKMPKMTLVPRKFAELKKKEVEDNLIMEGVDEDSEDNKE